MRKPAGTWLANDKVYSFSSFVEATGQPLVDLSLFLTPKNYIAVTRPLYSALFPWSLQYPGPLRLRERAKLRCEHLGLSATDIDSSFDPQSTKQAQGLMAGPPASFLEQTRSTTKTVMDKTQLANKIRLDGLATEFLQPIQELLGAKEYLLSEKQPSGLDCLVVGYLSLVLQPRLPQPWLSNKVRLSFARLCGYVENLQRTFYTISPEDKNHPRAEQSSGLATTSYPERKQGVGDTLPWVVPVPQRNIETQSLLLENVLDSLPLIKQLRATARLDRSLLEQHIEAKSTIGTWINGRNTGAGVMGLVALTAGLSLLVPSLLSAGTIFTSRQNRRESEKSNLDDYGEAGAALAVLADQMDQGVRI